MRFTFIASVLVLLLVSGCKQVELPDINMEDFSAENIKKGLAFGTQVYNASRDITPEQEYYVGRSVAASVLGKYKLYNNKTLNEYVNTVGSLLVLNSNKPENFGGYHFAVLESDEINAFATPGGFVFVSRGILRMCDNEDELAAVLAHEISHVQLRHGISSIKDSRWTGIATMLGSEASKKYAPKELASLTKSFEGSINDVVNTLVVNGYSREYELNADKYALDILSKTGYADSSMIKMLEKMQTVLKEDNRGFGSTHPKASERIESVSNELKNSNSVISTLRTKRFQLNLKNV